MTGHDGTHKIKTYYYVLFRAYKDDLYDDTLSESAIKTNTQEPWEAHWCSEWVKLIFSESYSFSDRSDSFG